MVTIKKMDEHDFIFVNNPLTAKEDKEFSAFLKNRKEKLKAKPNFRTSNRTKKVVA